MRVSPVEIQDLRQGYVDIVRSVRETGRSRAARGYRTWDVADAVFTVLDTTKLMPLGVGRQPREEIGYAEALLLCGGIASPSLLTDVSGSFRMFLDGGSLAGAYGPLVRPQLEHVVSTLKSDRDSRQAVVQVHPGLQNVIGLRDVPCTINLGFELRKSALHMRATMRSNDVWLGLTYDAFMFGQLGWTIANVLDVPLETYTHHAYSLHLYHRDSDKIDSLHDANYPGKSEPSGFGVPGAHSSYEAARLRAESLYERVLPDLPTQSEVMYSKKLDHQDRLVRKSNFAA